MSRPASDRGPEDLLSDIGARIRRMRTERGMTLEELSLRSEVSVGTLSQVERGRGNPALTTIVQVAHALGAPVAALLAPGKPTSPVVRRGERQRLGLHPSGNDEGSIHELLTPGIDHLLEAVWLESEPGHTTKDTPFVHEGEEVGIVLEGRMEVHVGADTHVLDAGDAITFASTIPHWFRNPGPHVVQAVWVITPPTW